MSAENTANISNCTVNAISQVADQCSFIRQHCQEPTNSVKFFYEFYFCNLNGIVPVFVIITILFLLVAFYILGSTADTHLSPALSKISEKLKLSETLAGVTLLAFSNGAPDVISSISAAGTAEGLPLVIGSSFGGGLFVTTFVLSVVILAAKSVQSESLALLRDIGFYLLATMYIVMLGLIGYVNLPLSIGFLLIYPCYVTVVYILERRNKNRLALDAAFLENADTMTQSNSQKVFTIEMEPRVRAEITGQIEADLKNELKKKDPVDAKETAEKSNDLTVASINPATENAPEKASQEDDEGPKSLLSKVFTICQMPLVILWKLTIPAVEEEDWNKWFAMIQPFTSVYFLLLAIGVIGITEPVWIGVYFLPFQIAASFCIYKYCSPTTPPKQEMLIASLALCLSIVWIFKVAVNVVLYLEFVGFLTQLHPAFLGLSLLTWGNSMGDLFGNRSLAKMGSGLMALTGCFAGPLFSLLVGFGLSLFRSVLESDGYLPFQIFKLTPEGIKQGSPLIIGVIVASVFNLCITLIYSKLRSWNFTRVYAFVLMGVYSVIIITATVYAFNLRVDYSTIREIYG